MVAPLDAENEGCRWREAAARLAQSLRQAQDHEQRLALLKQLARRCGDNPQLQGYPAFLKLLLIIGESDELDARHLVADAFVLGLRRLDLPSGSLTSWGAGAFSTSLQSASIAQLSGGYQMPAPTRQLGPVEYLTVWFCQRTQRPFLDERSFRRSLQGLVRLFDVQPELRQLYPLKIHADASGGFDGAYTRVTRERLLALAGAWQRGESAAAIASAAAQSARPPSHWVVHDL